MRTLYLHPVTLAEANAFVEKHHRHSNPVVGARFSVGVAQDGIVRGVAIVGRPLARNLDDGWTAEVLRVCTDGTHNACSMLYGTCWRAARAMGYGKLVTYTLKTEAGASLKAAGWRVVGEVKAGSWHRASRPTVDKHPLQERLRWEPVG